MRMMSYENDVCAAGCEVLAHQDEKLMQLASSLNSVSVVVKFCFFFGDRVLSGWKEAGQGLHRRGDWAAGLRDATARAKLAKVKSVASI